MKSQADIVSALLIVILAIGLVTTAYMWGIPLIQKRIDTRIVEIVDSYFDQNKAESLPSKIKNVANTEGEMTFFLDVDGIWELFPCSDKDAFGNFRPGCGDYKLENNSIQFSFFSRVTKIAADKGWISSTACQPSPGLLGEDEPSVVCARADSIGNGYNITYKIWFRELVDSSGKNAFKINLLQHPASSIISTGQKVKIIFSSRRQEVLGEKTLVVTEIKILLM